MIKLVDILTEVKASKRAIVMAGSAGAGKSTFVKQISQDLKKAGWEELNADKYVEDKDSPMYKNLSAASKQIEKVDLLDAMKSGRGFLYDTTGTNVERTRGIAESGYDVMMIMIYTHPMVSFLRNFSRERRVPTTGVITSWNNVYKNISEYQKMFGDKFILTQTGVSDEEAKAITAFEKAYKSGSLKKYFEDLLKTGQFASTFKKDTSKPKTPEEIAKSKEQLDKQIDMLASQFKEIEKQVAQFKTADMNDAVAKAKAFIK